MLIDTSEMHPHLLDSFIGSLGYDPRLLTSFTAVTAGQARCLVLTCPLVVPRS